MSSPPLESRPVLSESRLSPDIEAAIDAATSSQLGVFHSKLLEEELDSFDAARDTVREWAVDECRLAGIALDEQLELLQLHAADYDLQLGACDFETLRGHITGLTALVVGYLAQDRALQAVEVVLDLLAELDLGFDAVVADNDYDCFRHYAERDHGDWWVYEYRNLEDEGVHVDLFVYKAAGITFYVRQFFQRGSLSPREEEFAAS